MVRKTFREHIYFITIAIVIVKHMIKVQVMLMLNTRKLCESFNNNILKIVSPLLLQELINNYAVCKHCGRNVLLCEDMVSSHGFGRMWKFECETDTAHKNEVFS